MARTNIDALELIARFLGPSKHAETLTIVVEELRALREVERAANTFVVSDCESDCDFDDLLKALDAAAKLGEVPK